MLHWRAVARKLGSATVLVAALGFIAGNTFNNASNYVLGRVATRKDAELAQQNAQKERVRDEIVRWSNPILSAVDDLEDRLKNIQDEDGYRALSKDAKDRINQQWSMSYEYFLPSSAFLFSRYFCTVGLLEESLSVELFRKNEVKDAFFSRVYAVEEALSLFPNNDELSSIADARDRQVFGLQQRGIGEALLLSTNGNSRCMRYSEFMERWKEPSFQKAVEPITAFLDGLERDTRPWKRLTLMAAALEQLRIECGKRLSLEKDDSASDVARRRARL